MSAIEFPKQNRDPTAPSAEEPAANHNRASSPRDEREESTCRLQFVWAPLGMVELDDGKLRFPMVSNSPGLYRLRITFSDERRAVYFGESENVRRRFSNYRNPGPTQQTSLRIGQKLKELLAAGAQVTAAVADDAWFDISAGKVRADFSIKSIRRLFEQFAICSQHGLEIESLNR